MGAKFRNETEDSLFFTLAICRQLCSFTRGMCKPLHSDYCGNGNCCIISINIIGILGPKLICTCIFFCMKLNMDLPKAFIVHTPRASPLYPNLRLGTGKSCFSDIICKDLMPSHSADWQFLEDSLCFLYWLSAVKTFCMFGVQCLLLKLFGWLGVHMQDQRVVRKVLLRKLISQGESKMDFKKEDVSEDRCRKI